MIQQRSEKWWFSQEKIHELQTQQPKSIQSDVAAKDDILSQVFGEERQGLVLGLGNGPTP